ncbi:hypothetical protein AX15_007844 [Amanita polypyramis BW_CC]|nr:hypothetical protein AX15_007844 [Amanita polypyramis BW_CC]
MTNAECTAACNNAGYPLAGTEYATQCFCGYAVTNGGAPAPSTDCNMVCAGNISEFCGGPNRLDVYNNTAFAAMAPPTPVITAQIGNWTSLGCYSDNVNGRALPNGVAVTGSMTNAKCTSACLAGGFSLAGTEYAAECYCGNAIVNGGAPALASTCNMVCAGNSSEYCGGANRLNVYNYTAAISGGGGGPSTGVSPVLSGLPGTWAYNACWVDNAFGRALLVGLGGSPSNTVESCIAACQAQNYTIAGMEYSDECYCGNELVDGAVKGAEADCNMGCAGKATEACGGPNRLSIYSSNGNVTALPVPTILKTGLPGQWSYSGCLA